MVVTNKTEAGNITASFTQIEMHIILKAMAAYQQQTWGYESHKNDGFVEAADNLYSELVEAY